MSALSQYNQLSGQFGNVIDGLEAHRDSAYNLAYSEYENDLNEALMKGQTFIQIGESTAGLYKGARSIKKVYDNHVDRVKKIRANRKKAQGEDPEDEEEEEGGGGQEEDGGGGGTEGDDEQLARLSREADSDRNPSYQPTENRINQRLQQENQRSGEGLEDRVAEGEGEEPSLESDRVSSDFANRFLNRGTQEEGEEDLFTKGLTSEDKQNIIRANLGDAEPEAPVGEAFESIEGLPSGKGSERSLRLRRNINRAKADREAREKQQQEQAEGDDSLEGDTTQDFTDRFLSGSEKPPPQPESDPLNESQAQPQPQGQQPSDDILPAEQLGDEPEGLLEAGDENAINLNTGAEREAQEAQDAVPESEPSGGGNLYADPLNEPAPTSAFGEATPDEINAFSKLDGFGEEGAEALKTGSTLAEGAESMGAKALGAGASLLSEGAEASSGLFALAGATAEALPIVAGVAGLIGGVIELVTPHNKPAPKPIFSATSQSEFVAPHFDTVMDAPSMSSAF